ncbi:MAG: acyltransferase family protein [Gemmataceae bacterium]
MRIGRRLLDVFVMEPSRDLLRPPKGQIASLDFLRSCAILGVLAFHFSRSTYLALGGSENFFSRLPFISYGRVGVDLFFVLSGYLIGKQLWREMSRTGTINLTRFVLRRGLRIWPLYYAVLAFVVVHRRRSTEASLEGWWANCFFLSNYFPRFDMISGSWSLAVEEQFYIAAPLLLLGEAALRIPLPCYRWLLLALLGLLPLVRMLVHWRLTGDLTTPLSEDQITIYFQKPFHAHADGLVMGLLLAHLDVCDGSRFKQGLRGSCWPLLASAIVFVPFFHSLILADTGCALFFGSCTWFLLARRRSYLRILESWGFYLLSRLSYGMYLNHFFLLHFTAAATLRYIPGFGWTSAFQQMAGTMLLIGVSAGVALITFCLIEWPFLRLREWTFSGRSRLSAPMSSCSATRATAP